LAASEPAVAAEAPAAARPSSSSTRGSDDALNLGTTVLPILVKSYWKQVVAAVVVIGVVVWLVTR
jgi:hypothetical protein